MKYDLKMCVWEITLACCFSCKYCGSAGGRARENELSTAECLDVADQLKELGCRRVSMIGGEVFMRRDWKQIVKRLTDNGIRVNIITNGFLFREEQIKDLKDVRIESISISIDGPKAVHDKYRQEGSFDRAALAMETLLSSGIPVSVISTLNGENVKYLEEMFKFLGIPHYVMLDPEGRMINEIGNVHAEYPNMCSSKETFEQYFNTIKTACEACHANVAKPLNGISEKR